MTTVLHLLCAGAARAVAQALIPSFERDTGARVDATYGAVGALRERLAEGAACDVLVLSAELIDALRAEGFVASDSVAPLGRVPTSLAIRAGDPTPGVGTAGAVRAALLAADAIYFPDPQRATAGRHFAGVLERLGIARHVAERLRPFTNGAAAMAELAKAAETHPIGCTQATEILYTPGVTLVGSLPGDLALATVYTVAAAARSSAPVLARRFAASLAGDSAAQLRRAAGFDPVSWPNSGSE